LITFCLQYFPRAFNLPDWGELQYLSNATSANCKKQLIPLLAYRNNFQPKILIQTHYDWLPIDVFSHSKPNSVEGSRTLLRAYNWTENWPSWKCNRMQISVGMGGHTWPKDLASTSLYLWQHKQTQCKWLAVKRLLKCKTLDATKPQVGGNLCPLSGPLTH